MKEEFISVVKVARFLSGPQHGPCSDRDTLGIQVLSLGLLATDDSPDHTIILKDFLPFSGVLYLFFLLVLKSNTVPQPGPYELTVRI